MKTVRTLSLAVSLLALVAETSTAAPKMIIPPGGFKMIPGAFKKFQPKQPSKNLQIAKPGGLFGGPHSIGKIPPGILGKLKKSPPAGGSKPPKGKPPWWGPLANPGFWMGQLGQPHAPGNWSPGPSYYPPQQYQPEQMPVDPSWGYDNYQPAPDPLPSNSLDPPVELFNPAENGTVIHCRVSGQLVKLDPGQAIPLPAGQTWIIEFDRGGNFGRARYSMATGLHRFTRTSHGWELYRGPLNSAAGSGSMAHNDLPANSW